MSESINCNFARCAVRDICAKHITTELPRGKLPPIVREYNTCFSSEKQLQVSYSMASKCFTAIRKLFNRKWHPQEMREAYLHAFNIEAWKALTQAQKQEHTLTNCEVCQTKLC